MGILKVAGKVLLIPLWFIISIIGAGVKLLVHMVAIAKKILGLGIMALTGYRQLFWFVWEVF